MSKTDEYLNNVFDTSNFIVFTETWSEKGDPQLFDWDDDFEEVVKITEQRNSKRGRFSSSRGGGGWGGGEFYLFAQKDSYRLWLKIDVLDLGEEEMIICFLYIPPSDSVWYKSRKSFNSDKLEEEVSIYERKSPVFLIGDYNASVSLHKDYVINDDIDEFLKLPANYISDNDELIPMRKSRDVLHDSRGHENELLYFCKLTSYRIANGHLGIKEKDLGNFTCYKQNGNSTVDYVLLKEKDFDKISDFEIGELSEYSDHCYLNLKIKSSSQANSWANNDAFYPEIVKMTMMGYHLATQITCTKT